MDSRSGTATQQSCWAMDAAGRTRRQFGARIRAIEPAPTTVVRRDVPGPLNTVDSAGETRVDRVVPLSPPRAKPRPRMAGCLTAQDIRAQRHWPPLGRDGRPGTPINVDRGRPCALDERGPGPPTTEG